MYNFSSENTFEIILQRMLDRIPDSLDKRQGSIIYDALAPAASELAQNYISLDVYANQTNLLNAVGENLDNRAADFGMTRNPATYSQRVCTFLNNSGEPMSVNIGSRLSIPNDYGGYNYTVISALDETAGTYILQCETFGTVGDEYFGVLLPLTPINNLGSATLGDIYNNGKDEENDDDFRNRVLLKLREIPFGGNIAQYKSYLQDNENVSGIKTCIVIPTWNGGGTVKIVPIARGNTIPTTAKIEEIQTLIDPQSNPGAGEGLAPIGHVVTVTAPTEYLLNIVAYLDLEPNYTIDTIKPFIVEKLQEYVEEIQDLWDTQDTLNIYISRVRAAMYVQGVANVAAATINGESTDIILHPKEGNNPFPILNEEVELYEN